MLWFMMRLLWLTNNQKNCFFLLFRPNGRADCTTRTLIVSIDFAIKSASRIYWIVQLNPNNDKCNVRSTLFRSEAISFCSFCDRPQSTPAKLSLIKTQNTIPRCWVSWLKFIGRSDWYKVFKWDCWLCMLFVWMIERWDALSLCCAIDNNRRSGEHSNLYFIIFIPDCERDMRYLWSSITILQVASISMYPIPLIKC